MRFSAALAPTQRSENWQKKTKKSPKDMKLETKIASLILCLALPLITACKKTPIPAEDPQPAEVAFAASSQAVWVKSGETPTPTFPHDDFGVWGIARQGSLVYNLWGNDALMRVNKNTIS